MQAHSLLGSKTLMNAIKWIIFVPKMQKRLPRLLIKNYRKLRKVLLLPINPPSIPGLGTTGGMEMWIQSTGNNTIDQLSAAVDNYIAKAKQRPELSGITSTFNATSQQLLVEVDRTKSESLGSACPRCI